MPIRRKVVFITPSWGKPRTGPEVYAKYLWDAFRDDPEIEFHLVASGEGDTHPQLHLAPAPRGSLALYRDVALRAQALMNKIGPCGVMHVNNSNFHASLLRAPWPAIGQINDYETANFYDNFWRTLLNQGPRRLLSLWRRRLLEAKFVRQQAVTLCNSEYTRQQVIRAYGISDSSTIRLLYKAVNISDFVHPPGVKNVIGSRPSVLFAGSDFRRKGLDVLVDAIALSSRPLDLRVAGTTESTFESAFPGRLIRARARGSSVNFLGPVNRSSMPSLLWQSNIFCLPSRAEALGVALLEALAAGLPCVATNVGGIPEISKIVPGVTLVEPDNPGKLLKAIEIALSIRQQDLKLVAITKHFGLEAMIAKIRKLYLQMIP